MAIGEEEAWPSVLSQYQKYFAPQYYIEEIQEKMKVTILVCGVYLLLIT